MCRQFNSYSGTVLGFYRSATINTSPEAAAERHVRPVVGCVRTMGRYHGPRPMLVMPDDTPAHPYQTSVDIAALAPKAQSTVFPWREPKDLLEKTIDQVRRF